MAENDCKAEVAEGYVAEILSEKDGDTYKHCILVATAQGGDWFQVENTQFMDIDTANGNLCKGCTIVFVYKCNGDVKKTRRQVIVIKSYPAEALSPPECYGWSIDNELNGVKTA